MTNTATVSNTVVPAEPTTGVASTAAPAHSASIVPTKGGSRRVSKKNSKKSRKMGGAAKDWVNFVMEIFNKNRAKNPNYKYKQAMKDASKLKNKSKKNKKSKGGDADAPVPAPVPDATPQPPTATP